MKSKKFTKAEMKNLKAEALADNKRLMRGMFGSAIRLYLSNKKLVNSINTYLRKYDK